MKVCLYEDHTWKNFLPLTYLRPVFDLIYGASTLRQRVSELTTIDALLVRQELGKLYPGSSRARDSEPVLYLNGAALWKNLPHLDSESSWAGFDGGNKLVCLFVRDPAEFDEGIFFDKERLSNFAHHLPGIDLGDSCKLIEWPWEIIRQQESVLSRDLSTSNNGPGRSVEKFPGVHMLNPSQVSIDQTAKIGPCTVIDAEDGPVRISAGVRILPHSWLKGPVYVGPGSIVQAASRIREGSYIGPVCKVGGEIECSIIQGYSNKQHDGFLGHSYLGEWVNVGADSLNSDLKNTYGTVRMPINGIEHDTGCQFLGMIVGDHSKIGINVSVPTGAVIGISSNVATVPCPKFIPSFTWLTADGTAGYDIDRALLVSSRMMARRDKSLSPEEIDHLRWCHGHASEIESAEPYAKTGPVEKNTL